MRVSWDGDELRISKEGTGMRAANTRTVVSATGPPKPRAGLAAPFAVPFAVPFALPFALPVPPPLPPLALVGRDTTLPDSCESYSSSSP